MQQSKFIVYGLKQECPGGLSALNPMPIDASVSYYLTYKPGFDGVSSEYGVIYVPNFTAFYLLPFEYPSEIGPCH